MSSIVNPPTKEQLQTQVQWLEAEIERLRATNRWLVERLVNICYGRTTTHVEIEHHE
jgi:hypothetical protein